MTTTLAPTSACAPGGIGRCPGGRIPARRTGHVTNRRKLTERRRGFTGGVLIKKSGPHQAFSGVVLSRVRSGSSCACASRRTGAALGDSGSGGVSCRCGSGRSSGAKSAHPSRNYQENRSGKGRFRCAWKFPTAQRELGCENPGNCPPPVPLFLPHSGFHL